MIEHISHAAARVRGSRAWSRLVSLAEAVRGNRPLSITLATLLALSAWHAISILNVFDEYYKECEGCAPYPAMLWRGWASDPEGFESGMDWRDYDEWFLITGGYHCGYSGDAMPSLLPTDEGEYPAFTVLFTRHDDRTLGVHSDSGYSTVGDGSRYRAEVTWTYRLRGHALTREVTFVRDHDDIPAARFLAATGLSRADVEAWADAVLDDVVVGGYVRANAGRTRFSEADPGRWAYADETDWGGV